MLLLFFLFCLASAELVTNATVEVYYDSHGGLYLNYEQGYVNEIINNQNFELSAGDAKATFEIKNHQITLLHYFPQPKKEEKQLQGYYSPMYGKTLYVGVFRGANRKDTTKCTTDFRAREYVRIIDLGMRLWGANQFRISQGKDLYVSSQCLVIPEEIYGKGNSGTINNELYNAAKKIDKIPKVSVRWYVNDDYLGGWLGLAAVGSPMVVANRNSNYWLICKINWDVNDPNNNKIKVIMHEFGHSTGFHHGGTQSAATTGVYTTFNAIDNYNDCANIMGNCAPWDRTITANQYYVMIVRSKPEPWQFKYPEIGIHKYRLYAFDHPYSRYYLGTNESFHNDTEMIDGIEFKYNCIAIRVLVNKTLTSKYAGADGTSGSIMFEYKWNGAGQQSGQEFGVRVTYGFNQKGNLLQGNLDGFKSWGDSEIIPGVDYYPSDFDTGTLRVKVTKIYRTVLKESKEIEITKENKRRYDEPSYVELEIEFYPNRKPPTTSPPSGLPNFVFSPSFFNCKKSDGENGYSCSRSTTSSGWFYFVNNGNRNKNVPRLYKAGKINFIRARKSLRSFNGADYSSTLLCYGDNGKKCIEMNIESVSFSGVRRLNFQNGKVKRTKLNDVNATVEDMGNMNVIYGSGLEVGEGGRAFISDLFGNEKDIKVIDKSFLEMLPSLETDGFSEGAVMVKDKSGKVTYYNGFTLYNPQSGNRAAIEFNDENGGRFVLSPAVMPSNKHSTTTSLLFSIRLKADNWFIYPITYLKDNDFVFIDFKGVVPSGLIMTIETDMDEYSQDLSVLGGINDISYKLTFLEMNKATGGWGEIDRIKFNKDVQIQNIRPIYGSKVGNQITAVKAVSEDITFNGYKYRIESPATEAKYIYNKVDVDINGEEYSFDSSTSTQSVKSLEKKGLSTFVIVLIILAVIVVLVGIIFVYIKIKSKNKRSSRTTTRNAYSGQSSYGGAGSTYRPPIMGK